MSKEYTGVTAECSHFCNNKVTVAFVPRLLPAKANKFNEMYDDDASKFRVMMQEGKGDTAKRISYNLTVDEFIYIAENFQRNTLEIPVYRPKATQKAIETGKYAGYYYTSELKLEYIKGYNNPWKLSLRCGYDKVKGKIDVDTSKELKQLSTFLTRMELYKHFSKGLMAINAFVQIYAYPQIKAGYAKLAEYQKGNYDPCAELDMLQEEISNGTHDGENNISPNQVYNAPMDSVPQKNVRQMKLSVISQPIAVDGSIVCQVLIAGNKYNLYCQQFTQELNDSLVNQTILEANLFEYNGLLCYDGPCSR